MSETTEADNAGRAAVAPMTAPTMRPATTGVATAADAVAEPMTAPTIMPAMTGAATGAAGAAVAAEITAAGAATTGAAEVLQYRAMAGGGMSSLPPWPTAPRERTAPASG